MAANSALRVRRDRARDQLEGRISLAEKLLAVESIDYDSLQEKEREFDRWRDYNRTLLQTLFSDDLTASAYWHSKPVSMLRSSSNAANARTHNTQVREDVNFLRSTLEKLDLIEEAEPPAATRDKTTAALTQRLTEQQELAKRVLDHIDGGKVLSECLSTAIRLATLRGDAAEAAWLRLEMLGTAGGHATDLKAGVTVGGQKFLELHAAANPENIAVRDKVLSFSIRELEEFPPPRFDGQDQGAYRRALVFEDERKRVPNRVRERVHRFALAAHMEAQTQELATRILGADAIAVFALGGVLLDELVRAVASLGKPGSASTAAMQARTALLTLGRELYKGDGKHTSPDGRVWDARRSEKHMLHAFIDQLFERETDSAKGMELNACHEAIELAMRLGSKGKNPLAISSEEAETTVQQVFVVARAIAFSGGFPASLA